MSFLNRSINIRIKDKQFQRTNSDSPKSRHQFLHPYKNLKSERPQSKLELKSKPIPPPTSVKLGSKNFRSSHVVKSIVKNWMLPHNKFNYPHIPIQVTRNLPHSLLYKEKSRSKSGDQRQNSRLRLAYTNMSSV